MKKRFLSEWNYFIKSVQNQRVHLKPVDLALLISHFMKKIKQINHKGIQSLYHQHWSFYEKLSLSDYQHKAFPWLSLTELIDYELNKTQETNRERIFIIISNVLDTLLLFKCDRLCNYYGCGEGNLNVFANKDKTDLYFVCEICHQVEDIDRKPIKLNSNLIPAPTKMIESANIIAAKY